MSYIAERNVTAAQRSKDASEACAERLPEHPFLYHAERIDGTRETVVQPNYLLIYRKTTDTVEIISVVHARQQYP